MSKKATIPIMTIVVMLTIMCLSRCSPKLPFANCVNVKIWKFDNSMGVLHPNDADNTGIAEPVAYTEVSVTFNIARGTNMEEYKEWATGVLTKVRSAQGCYKCRFSTNILDSPRAKWTAWWLDFNHWAAFTESDQWQSILFNLHSKYANCINIEIWALDNSLSLLPEEQDEQQTKPEPYGGAEIEANMTFNLTPGVNPKKYGEWTNGAITKMINAPGCVGWCSAHNALDSPRVEWISWWNSMDDWAKFTASADWQKILLELSEPN
jgi:hypothetical protein